MAKTRITVEVPTSVMGWITLCNNGNAMLYYDRFKAMEAAREADANNLGCGPHTVQALSCSAGVRLIRLRSSNA